MHRKSIKKRYYSIYSYFQASNFIIKFIVLPMLMLLLIGSIIEAITKNIEFIIISGVFILLIKLLFDFGTKYVEYLKYGKVKVSKAQLEFLLHYLSPRQFEVFCAELFKGLGYDVELTPEGNDGGKDVILNDRIYVECKRFNKSMIGREICQKLLGAVEADGMEKGIIFTNGMLHENGKEMLLKTNRLELWNIDTIFIKLNSLEPYMASKVLDMAIKHEEGNEIEMSELQPEI